MNIDSIRDGIVIDHISAGKGMRLYELLGLDSLDAPVAIIKNAVSRKMGKKDIIKIDSPLPVNLDLIGFVDPGATVNIIREGRLAKKLNIKMPELLRGVIRCKNPRCISSTEQELEQVFKLADRKNKVYRCLYCEAKAQYDLGGERTPAP